SITVRGIMKNLSNKSFQTRAVHAGERAPAADYTPVSSPIFPSTTYVYESMDDLDAVFAGSKQGYVYSRYATPTVVAFEAAVASLEGAEAAQAYSSGMAAIHAALLAAGVRAGNCVVAALDLYGATYTLVRSLMASLGADVRMVNVSDLEEVESALKETHPAALLVETISNPLLKVADVPSLAALAHRYGASLLVDSTFASPYLFNPLQHGADYAIHSATKYLAGHGDVLAGVVATSAENKSKLFELNKLVGSVLGPFEAWLALRGLKTLPLRMCQQCENAQRVAEWLAQHPRVAKVNYPGLVDHPQHDLAERLFQGKGNGGVLSFEIKEADKAMVYRFMEALNVCLPATSLGDIYSLTLHPATSSHRSLTAEERARVGIPDGLVRLSTGIESADDILADLESALMKI
ncbi:MAG TPA: PLP-dependent aspartate aminotransferase family protein, partial [Anaerolineales bacterium]|nr:PLP-dependent aspartate aminotransferase family protein [Anaerolineales bacterium]